MPSKQVKDILDHIRSVHHQLNKVCRELSAGEPDARLQLLLEYIGRHEEVFNSAVRRYEKEANVKTAIETWLQFSADESINEAFHDLDLHPGMTAEEIVEQVLAFDAKLMTLYRDLADSTSSSQVRELFSDLVQMAEGKQHQYARILQEWE
ncbi:hypothetical protein C5Y96_22790 [Blastopirellula marina]|uniref:Rubrerythrin diiron-binding domain-containing protein n=1 Tax=Blastopirellula marina TaxID=124 RepID=A0A2S8F0F9_9BACT|nr:MULTISPECIES: hypothetical protein [Pirellulaceae]PQO25651.1 hypothetical protein C5Y96_22790 [Blastopirellula marina]RCS43334.1 hypothetical protein DTL36_22840 [Bremerella cremea]